MHMIEKAYIALNRLLVKIQMLKVLLVKGSEGTKEHFLGSQMKVYPCYIVAEGLSELSPTVVWKVECVSDEPSHLAEISKQSIGGMV